MKVIFIIHKRLLELTYIPDELISINDLQKVGIPAKILGKQSNKQDRDTISASIPGK